MYLIIILSRARGKQRYDESEFLEFSFQMKVTYFVNLQSSLKVSTSKLQAMEQLQIRVTFKADLTSGALRI